MADPVRALRTALVAIIGADATLQGAGYVGRATELIVAWEDLRLDGALPVIAYTILPLGQTGEDGDSWRGSVQCTVVAGGNDGLARAEAIVDRIRTIVTASALVAQGVNATPLRCVRIGDPEPLAGDEGTREGSRNLRRSDVEIELLVQV